VVVNNLPKVVTRNSLELNSRDHSCESNVLTTRLSSHPQEYKVLLKWVAAYDVVRWL